MTPPLVRLAVFVGLMATLLCLAAGASAQSRRPASVEDLMALNDAGGAYSELAVSVDGAFAAFIEQRKRLESDDYENVVVLVDIATGASREIGDAGPFLLRSDGGRHAGIGALRQPQFSGDGRFVYFLRSADGAVEIWEASTESGIARAIVQADGDIRRFRVVGATIVFETSTSRATLALDRQSQARSGFAISDTFTPSYSLTPLPAVDRDVATWTQDLTTGARRGIDRRDAAFYARDEYPLVHPLDAASEVDQPALGVFDDDGGRCTDEVCTGALIRAWRIDGATGQVLFQRSEGHARRTVAFYAWTPSSNSVRLVWRGDARVEGCAPTQQTLICLQDDVFEPKRLISIHLEDGVQRVLYDPNPQWRAVQRPRVERFDFTDGEGNESFAHLVYPLHWRRGRSYPLVIVQYRSRGFLYGGVGDETPILPLSARGYFVLSFDRPEFRSRSARMTLSALQREIELTGIERRAKREALDHFIEEAVARGAERRLMAITGLSDGAETAYAMLMDEPDVFAAAIISTPPTDPLAWVLQSPSFRARSFERLGLSDPWEGSPEPWRSWWNANSPALHARRISTPILFNLADAEVLRSFHLLTRLREFGRPYDAYLYPNAYHLKWRPQQIYAAQRRTIDWLDFWLRGVEHNDPTEPDRLERWRALRRAQSSSAPAH